jgi:hypothetical protein
MNDISIMKFLINKKAIIEPIIAHNDNKNLVVF